MKKNRLGLLLALVAFTTPAFADDISWTYAEAYLQYVDPKAASSDSGYHVEASLGLPLGFHAIGRWEKAELGSGLLRSATRIAKPESSMKTATR